MAASSYIPRTATLSNIVAQSSSSAAVDVTTKPNTITPLSVESPILQPSSSLWVPPVHLTLSAFRRPEWTVRLTDADPMKSIHAEYELLDPMRCRTLGHGASSTVRLAFRRRDGMPVAVKTIAKHDALGLWSKSDRRRRSSLFESSDKSWPEKQNGIDSTPRLDEVDVLTSLRGNCPNVVQLLDVFETNHEVQLVLEYCEGGDLFDCIKQRRQLCLERSHGLHGSAPGEALVQGHFPESEASAVAKTMLVVLDTLHSRHIVHRDIKPENILLEKQDGRGDRLQIKLTDFGLARILRSDGLNDLLTHQNESYIPGVAVVASGDCQTRGNRSRAYSRVGSDYYTAPEVNMGLGYDTPVDIYSLGITIYVMLCGAPPSSPFLHGFFKSKESFSSADVSECEAGSSSESEESVTASSWNTELFPPGLNVSPLAQDLICKMVQPDPCERISASDALKHDWISYHSVCQEHRACVEKERPRSLSVSETEALFRIPIQGSLHEIAPPVIPPSNSPTSKSNSEVDQKVPQVFTPPVVSTSTKAKVSLTLAKVCNKLAPLAGKQRRSKHRKYRRRDQSSVETMESRFPSGKKPATTKECSKNMFHSSKKKVRIEEPRHSSRYRMNSDYTYSTNRIAMRIEPPAPVGVPLIGPALPQNEVAIKGAN